LDKAIALANNDTVFLSWVYDQEIEDCLGFAVFRRDATGARTALPAWVGFAGGSNPDWQHRDTTVWPVQKFGWRDFTASRGQTYSYDIVPMTGDKDNLQPLTNKTLTTNSVTLTPKRGSFSSYFTNGILATQALTHLVPAGPSGAPNPTVLKGHITQPGDPLRMKLAGQVLEGMTMLLDRAKAEGGSCYLALYELADTELVQRLVDAKAYIHLILSNTGSDDAENHPARIQLHTAGVDIIDRMVANGHIGHNKFCLYVDATGKPRAVLSGSTNWTTTGICTQSNNAVVIESDALAQGYYDYWQRLKADGSAQGQPLRTADRTTPINATIDAATAKIWYSPNTEQTSKPKNAATPVDMADVFAAMAQAQNAILFLVFQPGSPSIVEYAAACENVKPGLLVYGAATDPHASNNFTTLLIHRTTTDMETVRDDVVEASAVNTQFGYWQKELLKMPGAHAIIHDKIVVIDPMTPNCVVIFGSHNQGYRASYNNDENMVIIKGHQPLAQAYATHVMDVYDHYRWRFTLKSASQKQAFSGLSTTSAWQDKYFAKDSTARREALFWTGQLAPLPAEAAPEVPTTPVNMPSAKTSSRKARTAANRHSTGTRKATVRRKTRKAKAAPADSTEPANGHSRKSTGRKSRTAASRHKTKTKKKTVRKKAHKATQSASRKKTTKRAASHHAARRRTEN
jgi:phosphatidylserine/phosphatidylglycerophosphate/cardiolipin synthase-like enzyme